MLATDFDIRLEDDAVEGEEKETTEAPATEGEGEEEAGE